MAIIGQGYDIVSLYMCITQYGSTAYIGMAMGCPALYRNFSLHFEFQFNLTSNDIKVENM